MITREELVHEMALAIVKEFMKNIDTGKTINGDAMAEAALDVVMAKVAVPVADLLENPTPFSKLAADHIRKLAKPYPRVGQS